MSWKALFVALLIAGSLGLVVVDTVVDLDSDEVRLYIEQAEAYCYQTTGSSELVNAMAMGNHGGLHCTAPGNEHHLHDVTDRALVAAYLANESGRTVDWSGVERYKPWHERGNVPFLIDIGSIAALIGLVAIAMQVGPRRF